MKSYIVIPARFGSTRFPGKLLAPLGGKPVVRWVTENALKVPRAVVVLATDDERIAQAVDGLDVKVVFTPSDLPSGTDRVAAAVKNMEPVDLVVNLQGDEPFLPPDLIAILIDRHVNSQCEIFTLARPMETDEDPRDPNLVKVVTDRNGRALYFSRSPIPYYRGEERGYHVHLGIYSYRWEALFKFVALEPSRLEKAEKLEQLRALENGMSIGVAMVEYRGIGIDTPEDLIRAEKLLK